MRTLLYTTLCWQLPGAAHGHGGMYEPPSRNSRCISFLTPGCAGGSCFWYVVGAQIGCNRSGGPPTNPGSDEQCMEYRNHAPTPCCDDPAEPVDGGHPDPNLRTFNIDNNNSGFPCPKYPNQTCGDWTKYHPWRRPGVAHVLDPCGTSGGSM